MGPILGGFPTLRYTATSATVSISGTSLVAGMPVTKISAVAPVNGTLTIYNAGVNGQTIAGARSGAAAKEDAQFDPTKTNVIIFWGATNSIWSGGLSGQQAHDEAKLYCQERLAAHPTSRIILCTELPRTDSATQGITDVRNMEINAYNALIRADYRAMGAVALADLRFPGSPFNLPDYTFSSFAALDSLWDTGVTGQRVHLVSAGYDVVCPVISAALRRVRR